MAAAGAAPSGDPKRIEGDEWYDSGLGSLGEGQLTPLTPSSPDPVPECVGKTQPGDKTETESERELWVRHVLSFVSEDGDTALHLAVIHEHEAFLDSILQRTAGTAYMDLQNDLGQTALHLAVILGLPSFVLKLRAAGAGLGLQERGGHTALHLACREGQPHCAQHLLGGLRCPLSEEERAQLESINYDGYTPLHVAILKKDVELVQLLLKAGADSNKAEPSCGRSPLHLAVEAQSPELAELLLKAGADPTARGYGGRTPLYSARHRPDPRLPQLLRAFGAPDSDGDSEDSEEEEEEEEDEGSQGDNSSGEEYDDIVINSGRCVD